MQVISEKIGFSNHPYFSWTIESQDQNIMQEAYQIKVRERAGQIVWDSGRIESGDSVSIAYAGKNLKDCTAYDYTITVWDNRQNCGSDAGWFETGFLNPSEWHASWIEPSKLPQLPENPLKQALEIWNSYTEKLMRGEPAEYKSETEILDALPKEPFDPAAVFRRKFTASGKVKTARMYVSSHGIYDAQINHQAVTDSVLNPGFTSYDKRIHYQIYDVCNLIQEENEIRVTVADGWYKGKIAIGKGDEYGDCVGLLLKLVIVYEDGHSDVIRTDGDWEYTYDGPVRAADLYMGEVYDANYDPDQAEWKQVFVREKPDEKLELQEYPLAKYVAEVPAKRVWTAPNGDTLLDFGQNLAGVIRVNVRGEKGKKFIFEHGENLDKDGNFFYIFNDSETRAQRDIYICSGRGDEFHPVFTYHGFRYIRIIGGNKWKKEDFTALAVSTDNQLTGYFHTDSEELNRLQSNILWSQRSNNITIPTDCPTREKAGWTGDVVVYGATALFNQNMTRFYEDWLRSIRTEQRENGQILNTVPQIRSYISQADAGSLGWGDVILTLPWQLYKLCGEKRILAENYEAMGKWIKAMQAEAYELPNPYNTTMGTYDPAVESMTGRRLENQHYLINSGFHFGDWIIPSVVNEQGFTDGPMSAFLTMNYSDTSILAGICDLYAEISEILGEKKAAESTRAYAKRVREAFTEEYVTEDHRLGQEMQGNYILALKNKMVPEEIAVDFARRLNELIKANGNRLDTGFMSTPFILDVLCDYGYQETAWKILFQDKCPSWLYEVKKGATTMWENWDAVRPDGNLNDCSFNHYAFGCVGDFMYRRILGIQNAGVGYKSVVIHPEFSVPLTHVEGSYESACGKISLMWEKKDGKIHMEGRIPANTQAEIWISDNVRKKIGNGSFEFTFQENV